MASRTIAYAATVALAGFAAPAYIDNPSNNATGFEIMDTKAVALSIMSMGTNTVVAEQTLDRNGLVGWFPVLGKRVDDAGGSLASVMAAAKAYVFPAIGMRMRFRVTALAGADLVASVALLSETLDQALGGANVASASASIGAGTTHHKVKAAASTNLTLVKGGLAKLYRYTLRNNTASAKFLKLYNKATAPVIATDTAQLIETVIIPANGVATYLNPTGKAMSLGIGYAITGAIGETDTTVTAVDDVVGSFDYI